MLLFAFCAICAGLLGSSYLRRDSKAASSVLAWIGFLPVGIAAVFFAAIFRSRHMVPEAIVIVFLTGLVGGAVLATIFTAMALRIWATPGVARLLGWTILLGAGLAPAHFLIMPDPITTFGPDWQPFMMFAVVDAICIGFLLAWLASLGAGEKLENAGHLALAAVPVAGCLFGAYLLPDVAFQSHRIYKPPMNALAKIGARRALGGEGKYRTKAITALAIEGDKEMLKTALKDFVDGTMDPSLSYQFPRILSDNFGPDPQIADAFLARLEKLSHTQGKPNIFGDREFDIQNICKVLKQTRDPRAASALIRIFEGTQGEGSIKRDIAETLVAIGGDEAARFVAAQLDKLDMAKDRALIEELRTLNHPLLEKAKGVIQEKVDQQREESLNVQGLVNTNNIEGLRRRAFEGRSFERGEATIALIKMRDPKRIEAALASTYDIRYLGKQLGRKPDPELLKALIGRLHLDSKKPDLNVARFVAEWAPPDSVPIQSRMLMRLSLGEAADALGEIGGPESAKALLRRLKSLPPSAAFLELRVIRALGKMRADDAVKPLIAILRRPEERPSLNFSGKDIYTSDVAAQALRDIGTQEAMRAGLAHRFKGEYAPMIEWYKRS